MNKKMSVKMKLFLILSITILTIIAFLILANDIILEKYYLYSKEQKLLNAYKYINNYYNK